MVRLLPRLYLRVTGRLPHDSI